MNKKIAAISLGLSLGLFNFLPASASAVVVVAVAQDASVAGASWAPDFQTAEAQAMSSCGQSNCMVLNEQEEGCIAVTRSNGVADASSGPDVASAQQTVLNYSGGAQLWFYACADGSNNL